MATFTVKATDDQMARWRREADRAGVPFDAWVHGRLDGRAAYDDDAGYDWKLGDLAGPARPDPKPERKR